MLSQNRIHLGYVKLVFKTFVYEIYKCCLKSLTFKLKCSKPNTPKQIFTLNWTSRQSASQDHILYIKWNIVHSFEAKSNHFIHFHANLAYINYIFHHVYNTSKVTCNFRKTIYTEVVIGLQKNKRTKLNPRIAVITPQKTNFLCFGLKFFICAIHDCVSVPGRHHYSKNCGVHFDTLKCNQNLN